MSKPVHAILVDDDVGDRKYAERLTAAGLSCESMVPPSDLSDLARTISRSFEAGECDLVLLDYRLDSSPSDHADRRVDYRGAQAAAAIREHSPGIPLVLVTTEPKMRPVLAQSPGLRGLFDYEVLKKRLASRQDRADVVVELADLAEGFRQIREAGDIDWLGIGGLLGAPGDVMVALSRAELPSGVAGTASWIINELLKLSGPLVDAPDAAAVLGIALSSFNRDETRSAIASTRYNGPFGSWHERWWRHDLEVWLSTLEAGTESLDRSRSQMVARQLNLSNRIIRSSSCNWCGSREVTQTCLLCREPIDGVHGLVVVRDAPHWAKRPVACYVCIQMGRAEGAPFQPGTEATVSALKSGSLEQEPSNG